MEWVGSEGGGQRNFALGEATFVTKKRRISSNLYLSTHPNQSHSRTKEMQAYEVNVDEDFYEDGVDFGMQAGDQLYTDAENGKSISFLSLCTS